MESGEREDGLEETPISRVKCHLGNDSSPDCRRVGIGEEGVRSGGGVMVH